MRQPRASSQTRARLERESQLTHHLFVISCNLCSSIQLGREVHAHKLSLFSRHVSALTTFADDTEYHETRRLSSCSMCLVRDLLSQASPLDYRLQPSACSSDPSCESIRLVNEYSYSTRRSRYRCLRVKRSFNRQASYALWWGDRSRGRELSRDRQLEKILRRRHALGRRNV